MKWTGVIMNQLQRLNSEPLVLRNRDGEIVSFLQPPTSMPPVYMPYVYPAAASSSRNPTSVGSSDLNPFPCGIIMEATNHGGNSSDSGSSIRSGSESGSGGVGGFYGGGRYLVGPEQQPMFLGAYQSVGADGSGLCGIGGFPGGSRPPWMGADPGSNREVGEVESIKSMVAAIDSAKPSKNSEILVAACHYMMLTQGFTYLTEQPSTVAGSAPSLKGFVHYSFPSSKYNFCDMQRSLPVINM